MLIMTKSLVVVALTTALSMPVVTQANEHHGQWHRADSQSHDRGDHHFRLKVALWGDEFYDKDEVVKTAKIAQTINSMNAHDLDFTIFAGDSKNGSSLCSDEAIGQNIVNIFNSLEAPTMYSVGDNEWTDCHRTNNGSYNPLERLAYLRSVFFNKNTTQGQHPITVERQGDLGQAYSENSRFVKNNVEFVALHIPGSNNNLVVTEKQCTKKSNRSQADCDAATAEYQARNIRNIEWLKSSFAMARANHNAGILIAIQADVYFPFEMSDGGYQEAFLPSLDANNGYSGFVHTLIEETQSFAGKVVLVHGDSHYFKIDKPMFNNDGRLTANFTRVEVFGSADNSWVEMTVDPTTENVFDFKQVNLQ